MQGPISLAWRQNVRMVTTAVPGELAMEATFRVQFAISSTIGRVRTVAPTVIGTFA